MKRVSVWCKLTIRLYEGSFGVLYPKKVRYNVNCVKVLSDS